MFIIEEDGGGWWMVISISMRTTKVWAVSLHTEFSVRLDEMMIIFILEFINSDCTILSGLVSHFQKGITLGCLL